MTTEHQRSMGDAVNKLLDILEQDEITATRNKMLIAKGLLGRGDEMTTYNGHKDVHHWNVSLWLNNDMPLYRMMKHYIKEYDNVNDAAEWMLKDLNSLNITKTPDNHRYTVPTIKAAMRGMK